MAIDKLHQKIKLCNQHCKHEHLLKAHHNEFFFVNTPTPTAPINFFNTKDMEKLFEFTFKTKNIFSPKNSIKKNDKFC